MLIGGKTFGFSCERQHEQVVLAHASPLLKAMCTHGLIENDQLAHENACFIQVMLLIIIIITISSIAIGLKNSHFPLIRLPNCYRTICHQTACYRTVQQTNHIQSCSFNQPMTTLVSITIETVDKLLNLCILCQFFKVKKSPIK